MIGAPPGRRIRLLLGTVAAGVAGLLWGGIATAATLTVTTTDETSATDCTLGDAISSANFDANSGHCVGAGTYGDDTIAITATGTMNLTNALPSFTSNVVVNGPGASQLNVHRQDGSPHFRIFSIQSGKTVSISGLTASNGLLTILGLAGAGIGNFGTLTLGGVKVTGNEVHYTEDTLNPAPSGGGILNGGTLTLTRSTVSGNTVTAEQTASSGQTSADAVGGGIENNGTLTVERSTISGNTTSAGVASNDPNASTFAAGGGIHNWTSSSATVHLSTVSGNQALASAPPPAFTTTRGGGVANFFGTLTATSDTIAFNTGTSSANYWAQGTDTFTNTIISDPQGGPNCEDTINTDGGFNLDSGSSCNLSQPTDLSGTDPQLLPLADNGGPTRTHNLLPTSPGIDHGTSGSDTADQREFDRPVDIASISNTDDGSDIGALEVQPQPETTIDSVKINQRRRKATFEFSSSEPGSTFLCSLDGKPFRVCETPKTYKHLKIRRHKFKVEAVSPEASIDPTPAVQKFRITG